jgi:mono/diheme cytochrome c family protein
MNQLRVLFLLITIALLSAACKENSASTGGTKPATPPATPAATTDEFSAARLTYAKNCVSCHGDNGQGGVAEVEGKKIKGPPFRTGHALKHSNDDFKKQIEKGGDGMPAYADKMSTKEIDEMIRFLRHEFQPGNTPPTGP